MVLFENEHFLIIEKRAGWLSIPGRFGDAKEATPCEVTHWKEKLKTELWIVHRLDREVSGVMCFARNADAHRAANGWFENRSVHKTYEALATKAKEAADPELEKVQRWKSRLLRGKKRAYEKPFGKEALTEGIFQRTYDFNGLALELWQLLPLTGRAHQLRYEMAKHYRPIWGDELYGSQHLFPIEGAIGLRAVKLDFSKSPEREKWGLPEAVTTTGLISYLTSRC